MKKLVRGGDTFDKIVDQDYMTSVSIQNMYVLQRTSKLNTTLFVKTWGDIKMENVKREFHLGTPS